MTSVTQIIWCKIVWWLVNWKGFGTERLWHNWGTVWNWAVKAQFRYSLELRGHGAVELQFGTERSWRSWVTIWNWEVVAQLSYNLELRGHGAVELQFGTERSWRSWVTIWNWEVMAQLRYNFDIHVEGLRERANTYKYFMPRRRCEPGISRTQIQRVTASLLCSGSASHYRRAQPLYCGAATRRRWAHVGVPGELLHMRTESLPYNSCITDARMEPSVSILPSCLCSSTTSRDLSTVLQVSWAGDVTCSLSLMSLGSTLPLTVSSRVMMPWFLMVSVAVRTVTFFTNSKLGNLLCRSSSQHLRAPVTAVGRHSLFTVLCTCQPHPDWHQVTLQRVANLPLFKNKELPSITVVTHSSAAGILLSIIMDRYRFRTITVLFYRHALLHGRGMSITID